MTHVPTWDGSSPEPALPTIDDSSITDSSITDSSSESSTAHASSTSGTAGRSAGPIVEPGSPAEQDDLPRFTDFDLPRPISRAVAALGFTSPTAIQSAAIPALLDGRDVAGVAQTGTGKTAAFGLPLLAAIDPRLDTVQALVLCPTRELALQVSAALESFATGLKGLSFVTVYGGSPFHPQRQALARGAQVVVGTPGRVIDHLDRGTLRLSDLRFLVLDEADEMLTMGFAEDVDRILRDAPTAAEGRQTALFSATMPPAIRAVASAHLNRPVDVSIRTQTLTTGTVEQTYAVVPFPAKVDALSRLLEFDALTRGTAQSAAPNGGPAREQPGAASIVFVRTKSACEEVATALVARKVAAASLNGDVPQRERERIVSRLREGSLDVVVATDVAARGLDVERIGTVYNFDAPRDPETYVHRIGRTGRAGRNGKAVTFFTPRETFKIRVIQRATGADLTEIVPPSAADLAAHRTTRLMQSAASRLQGERIALFKEQLGAFAEANDLTVEDLAAALLASAAGDDGAPRMAPSAKRARRGTDADGRDTRAESGRGGRDWAGHGTGRAGRGAGRHRAPAGADRGPVGPRREPRRTRHDGPLGVRYRVEVGRRHGVRPAAIVGAITGEGGLAGSDLGRIDIFDGHSTVEIGAKLSSAALRRISGATVSGEKLRIRRA
ncbi:MAG: DEAD/DEAH box helicase [Actinomycetales bacterium]